MGGKQSTTAKTAINQKTLNSTIFNQVNKNTTTVSADATITQLMDIDGVKYYGCTLVAEQSTDVNFKQVQQFTDKSTTKLIDEMAATIGSDVKNSLAQESSGFGNFGSQSASTDTTINNEIKNVLEQTLTNETLNEIVNKVQVTQTMNLKNTVVNPCGYPMRKGEIYWGRMSKDQIEAITNNCDPSAECKLGQYVAVTLVSEQIADKAMTAISESKKISESIASASNEISQKKMGIAVSGGGGSSSSCLLLLGLVVAGSAL